LTVCAALVLPVVIASVIAALFHEVEWIVPILAGVLTAALMAWVISKQFHGVFVGDGGVKIVSPAGTETFAWQRIDRFEARTARREIELAGKWQTLWIITTSGRALETDVVRGLYATRFSPMYRRMAPGPLGLYLFESDFDAVLADLTAELKARRNAAPTTV
jgi:hypothetical protein